MDVWGIVAGVLVFLVGQFVLKLTLEPLVAVRSTLAEARITHQFFADIHANPPPKRGGGAPTTRELEASRALRRTAGELQVAPVSVVGYRVIRSIFGMPSAEELRQAASGFIGLSNTLFGGTEYSIEHAARYSDRIKQSLRWPE